jgi:hypothetical protein
VSSIAHRYERQPYRSAVTDNQLTAAIITVMRGCVNAEAISVSFRISTLHERVPEPPHSAES